MNSVEVNASAMPPKPRRWRRIIAAVFAATLLLALGLGVLVWFKYQSYCAAMAQADERLAKAIAAADAEDPDWRWEAMLDKRPQPPAGANSATLILEAEALLPKDWKAVRNDPVDDANFAHLIDKLPRNRRLPPQLARELQLLLDEIQPALAKARRLDGEWVGHFEIDARAEPFAVLIPQFQSVMRVAELMHLDAASRLQSERFSESLQSLRAWLTIARSSSNEPIVISQFASQNCECQALDMLERLLALGTYTDADLKQLQDLLIRMIGDGELEFMVRSDRALTHATLEYWQDYDAPLHPKRERIKDKPWHSRWEWEGKQPAFREAWAEYLEKMSLAIDAARRPMPEQLAACEEWARVNVQQERNFDRHVLRENVPRVLLPDLGHLAQACARRQAYLRCAVLALAAERFRLTWWRWPRDVDELAPFVPTQALQDPFAKGRLTLRPWKEGVIIISAGADGCDGSGILSEDERKQRKAVRLGFRLWNPELRGLPALEAPGFWGRLGLPRV